MGRRRGGGGGASEAFELFLDTICNAFGGVIFILLLVCVLLQLSGVAPARPQDVLAEKEAGGRLARLKDEIDRLRTEKGIQDEQLAAFLPHSDEGLVGRYREIVVEQRNEHAAAVTIAAAVKPAQDNVAAATTAYESAKGAVERLKGELAGAKEALAKAAARPAARIRVPRFRQTDRPMVPLLIEGGRIAPRLVYGASGEPLRDNVEDVDVVVRGSPTGLRLKAGRGVAIAQGPELGPTLERVLGRFDKGKIYFMFAVWPDSYAQFESVRDWAVDHGYDYGLLLLEKEKPVFEGANAAGGTQ